MTPTPYAHLPAELVDDLTAAGLDPDHVWDVVSRALMEDLPDDRTTTRPASRPSPPTPAPRPSSAAREPGVVAGLGVAAVAFFMVGADATITDRVADGTRVEKGDVVMRVEPG